MEHIEKRFRKITVIDSHTGGEPTRVVTAGGPDLGSGSVSNRWAIFRDCHDEFRRAIVNEPRGSDVMVGALLVEPSDPTCVAGVIYFDNVQCIGMCGHGTIGLVTTLHFLGRIAVGHHRIETSVGVVTVELHADGQVSVTNVPSFRKAKDASIELEDEGTVVGDLAWGGNWFYLIEQHSHRLDLNNVEELTRFTWRIRQAINRQGYPEVDHIILYGDPRSDDADARNFVLCPGKSYDRSPCGTGTSARMACLAADNRLAENESLVQESIVGSRFIGRYRWQDRATGSIVPTITGTAYIMGQATLLIDDRDPFRFGISRELS